MNAALPNGAASAGGDDVLAQITRALELIYSPYSTNQSRQEAQSFLEEVKALPQAPQHGFRLASEKSQSPILRHYGLSLLEHAIKHRWGEYSPEEAAQYFREWTLQLSQSVSREDPSYLRSKVAQLWVDLAGRCWGSDWMDMDELLVQMWQVPDSAVHRELVLQILEALSVEVFDGDSPVFSIREKVLKQACVEVFTPASVLLEAFPNRQEGPPVRCGDEGWLKRVGLFLEECLNGDVQNNEDVRTCAVRCLTVYYSCMTWAVPKAISSAQCVGHMCRGLAAAHVAVQKAALEGLHALYFRQSFSSDEFEELVLPMYGVEFVDLSRRLFEWSTVDANDVDDDKYQFAKKFSEMISSLGQYLPRRYSHVPSGTNIHGFLELLLLIVQSQSLVVSIPVLVTWTKLLAHKTLGPLIANTPLVGPLLEVCSSRLVRYENLPEDTEDPSYLLLLEDTDTIPERHVFLGNYRRYSSQVIESIVQLQLSDAFSHILRQTETVLGSLYDGQPSLDVANYNKNSMPVLKVDAHFTVIESALKGYVKWRRGDSSQEAPSAQDLQTRAALESEFQQWCDRLLQMEIQDPMIRKRRLQLLVAFSTTALDKNPEFMMKVLSHILATWPAAQPEYKTFNDAIKELQSESIVELQRLTAKMPDHLLNFYDQLEGRIQEMIASGSLDEKRQLAYQGFLFTVTHRASQLDQDTRVQRLRAFVEPVQTLWTNENLKQALASFAGFSELICLNKAQDYIVRRRVHEIGDWGSVELDDEGRALQKEMDERQNMLPLRPTKSFLNLSVEKVDKGSSSYQAAIAIWRDALPTILFELLQFLGHAHAAHNPANWSSLGPDMQSVVTTVLTDRFWQAGISEGSKDEFYARVMDKKNTLEGLGSSIRGTIRFVRESCYSIIYCMSMLDELFYGFKELPGPLANALFADSFSLSSHQIINLLNLVRYLVDHCPVELRAQFLPPLLATCFREMDRKITSEWERLAARAGVQAESDALTEEMKAESILRQLTYTAVVMVADFLDPARTNPPTFNPDGTPVYAPHLRRFCLRNREIAEPLLLFCKNAIRMRDSRCCGVVLRVFKSIVPEFYTDGPVSSDGGADPFRIPVQTAHDIREFISSEVLQACISSLHDAYFVDNQKDIASLIASILFHYASHTDTPERVLSSLPGIPLSAAQDLINVLRKSATLGSRHQRGLVLEFLQDFKGVTVSEMGKVGEMAPTKESSAARRTAPKRSRMAQAFMTAPGGGPGGPGGGGAGGADGGNKQQSPDLEGVSGLFDQS